MTTFLKFWIVCILIQVLSCSKVSTMSCISSGLCSKGLTSAAKPFGRQRFSFMLPISSSCSVNWSCSSDFQQHSTLMIKSGTYLSSSLSSYVPKGKSIKFRSTKIVRDTEPLVLSPSLKPIGCRLFPKLTNRHRKVTLKLLLPKDDSLFRHKTWILGGCTMGMCVYFSSSETALAEAWKESNGEISKPVIASHGKKVYRDYAITGIPGDGRCLFRSVVHGACIRSGKPTPDEVLQRKLADELRNQVADEFIKRRAETEWFIEGDFDMYVLRMRQPHVWGGEPELLMASHVLRMPITVYMHDKDSGGLIEIAEYGQEYGKEDPVRVLYHGFGHYDALLIPGKKSIRSKI